MAPRATGDGGPDARLYHLCNEKNALQNPIDPYSVSKHSTIQPHIG